MPRYSDSNYAAVTRKRRYASHIPTVALSEDGGVFASFPTGPSASSSSMLGPLDWPGEVLEPDDVDITRHEAAVAPLLEEGELDADAIVVSPTGNSSSAATVASERRRREDGWNDLALDPFVEAAAQSTAAAAAATAAEAADIPPGVSIDDTYDPPSPEAPAAADTPRGEPEAP